MIWRPFPRFSLLAKLPKFPTIILWCTYNWAIWCWILYEWLLGSLKKKLSECKDTNQIPPEESIKSTIAQCTPIELGDDDLYHASLCSMVVCESTDVKECSQLLQSSSRRSLQAVSMTELLEDPVIFPKCMIALFSDDSGKKTCFVAFKDFAFQEMLNCSIAHSKATFGAG